MESMSKTSNNKRIAKNTLMLYIRMVLLMLVNLYTSRIVLQVLGVEDYGLYSIVGAVVIFLGFINISMASASQRFLSYYQGKGVFEELSSAFNSIQVVQFIISVLIFVLGETIGVIYIEYFLNVDPAKLSAAHIVYQFSLFSFIIKTLTVPYNASIIANERMNIFALYSIIEALLQLVVVFVLQTVVDNKLVVYALMMFLSVFIVQMCYRIYCLRNFKECKFRRNWSKAVVKDVFFYSGWNLLGSLSSVAIDQGINMILNSFFGVVVNAARGIAFQVSGAVASLSGNFQQALNPQIVKTFAEQEFVMMHALVIKGTRFCFYLLLLLSIPVIFNMHYLLELWLGAVPDYTETFCKLVLINSLINAFSGSLMMGALATGKIKTYQLVVASINLFNIPASILCLYFYRDPYVTVYVMIALSIIAFVARLILSGRMIGMSISLFLKRAVMPSVVVLLLSVTWSVVVDFFINDFNLWQVIARIILSVIGTVLFIAIVGVSKNERYMVLDAIKQKIKR